MEFMEKKLDLYNKQDNVVVMRALIIETQVEIFIFQSSVLQDEEEQYSCAWSEQQ